MKNEIFLELPVYKICLFLIILDLYSGIFLGGLMAGAGPVACTLAAYLSALYFRQPQGKVSGQLRQAQGSGKRRGV